MLGVLRELSRALRTTSVLCRPGRAAVGRRLRPTSRSRLGIGRRDDRPIRARHASCACPATARNASPSVRPTSSRSRSAGCGWSGGPPNWASSTAAPTRNWSPSGPAADSIWPGPACSAARNWSPSCGRRCPGEARSPRRCCAWASTPATIRTTGDRSCCCGPNASLPQANLGARAADLEIGQMADFDSYFQTAGVAGSLFFHQPREVRIESFDQKSPFKPSYTWLVSQPVPSGQQNRRRFVHSLATLDAQVMVDGGWLLPMGQEEAIRGLVAAYRALPPIRFQPVGQPPAERRQPAGHVPQRRAWRPNLPVCRQRRPLWRHGAGPRRGRPGLPHRGT